MPLAVRGLNLRGWMLAGDVQYIAGRLNGDDPAEFIAQVNHYRSTTASNDRLQASRRDRARHGHRAVLGIRQPGLRGRAGAPCAGNSRPISCCTTRPRPAGTTVICARTIPSCRGRFWKIGQSGQGDGWLLGRDGQVHWFDHNHGDIAEGLLLGMGVDLAQWIELARVIRQYEQMLDADEALFDDAACREEFRQALNAIAHAVRPVSYGYFWRRMHLVLLLLTTRPPTPATSSAG